MRHVKDETASTDEATIKDEGVARHFREAPSMRHWVFARKLVVCLFRQPRQPMLKARSKVLEVIVVWNGGPDHGALQDRSYACTCLVFPLLY